jgi:hypothetical protein
VRAYAPHTCTGTHARASAYVDGGGEVEIDLVAAMHARAQVPGRAGHVRALWYTYRSSSQGDTTMPASPLQRRLGRSCPFVDPTLLAGHAEINATAPHLHMQV